jgi:uncharacterized protein (DUF1501 family)
MSRLENVFRNFEIFPEFHLIGNQISSYQAGEALLIFSFTENVKKKKSTFPSAVPQGSRRLRHPEFVDIWHVKVVSFSALGTGRLNPLISVISARRWVDPRAVV